MRNKIIRFVGCFIICQGAGILGSIFTTPEIGGWYAKLVKPSFAPPNWLFAPVWTLLFTMMAVALYIIWSSRSDNGKRAALATFAAQLLLNVAWSAVFFGGHMMLGGFFVVIALWIMITLSIYRFKIVSPLAAWLMVPYLCWVTFAGVLNFYYWWLNI
jgi:translocator protein